MTDTPKRLSTTLPLTDTPPIPPSKRPRFENESENGKTLKENVAPNSDESCFCPANMHLVSVLSNDLRSSCLILHTRFENSLDKDAIVILKKAPFPTDPKVLQQNKLVHKLLSSEDPSTIVTSDLSESNISSFPCWEAKSILNNDVYHRLLVTAGLESLNQVDMTVIHPAQPHHFKRYTRAGRHMIQETPELYSSAIIPYLSKTPRDLSWVDNILTGKAECDRVLFTTDSTHDYGFTLVLDYRWNEQRIRELHCLGIAHDPQLTCLRDLRVTHLPMLKHLLTEGRRTLALKYTGDDSTPGPIREDQIMVYLHYPPTFYRLHVHFVHVDAADDGGTRAGRAHLLEEVIRNLELDENYYAERVMTIYLQDRDPMLDAVQQFHSKSLSEQDGDSEHPES